MRNGAMKKRIIRIETEVPAPSGLSLIGTCILVIWMYIRKYVASGHIFT